MSKRALALLERAGRSSPITRPLTDTPLMHHHFLRDGMHEENRAASIGHAQAAVTHGQDDAAALTLAGFTIGMDGRDRAAASPPSRRPSR